METVDALVEAFPDNELDLQPSELERFLQDYTLAADALEEFRAQNAALLGQLDFLVDHLADCEAGLKALAREQGPVANARFAVTVQRKTRRWYDVDYILEHAPYVRQIPGVVIQTIDRAKIEALAKVKAIDAVVCDAALREEPLTPAVTIKRLG